MKDGRSLRRRVPRVVTVSALTVLLPAIAWSGWGRVTAADRRLTVERAAGVVATIPRSDGTVRVLAWNIAHGRGDTEQGILRNWTGGGRTERLDRLERIADALRRIDADVVILNEVDFDAGWSGGLNQAAFLASTAGYPSRVEQRNFDFRVPFESWAFGNAVLTRHVVVDVRWMELPGHSWWEEILLGSKDAALVRLTVGIDTLSVVPVHLEFRSGDTRLRATPVLEEVRAEESAPVVLAGDFNMAPTGWPEAERATVVDELLRTGWQSLRATRAPTPDELTFPTYDLREARDWILVEPPLRVLEAHVVRGTASLSDHAPVLAVVELPSARPGEPQEH